MSNIKIKFNIETNLAQVAKVGSVWISSGIEHIFIPE